MNFQLEQNGSSSKSHQLKFLQTEKIRHMFLLSQRQKKSYLRILELQIYFTFKSFFILSLFQQKNSKIQGKYIEAYFSMLVDEKKVRLTQIDEEIGRFADFIGLTCNAKSTDIKISQFKIHGTKHPANDVYHGCSDLFKNKSRLR